MVVDGDNTGVVTTGEGDTAESLSDTTSVDSEAENKPAWERWLKIFATLASIIGVLVAIWVAFT